MIEVVAAMIHQGNTFLIAQRSPLKAQGMLWEFAGGKVEKGETKQQALIRECQEELDITLDVQQAVTDVIYNYPEISIHLTLFDAEIIQGEPVMKEHHDLKWITAAEVSQYRFCPADEMMLKKIHML